MTNRHLPFVRHQTTLNKEHIAGCLPLVCKLQGLRRSNRQLFQRIYVFYRKVHKNRKNIRSVLCPILYEGREPLKLKPEAPPHEPSCRSDSSAHGCQRQSHVAAGNESISRSRCRLTTMYVIMFCNAHEDWLVKGSNAPLQKSETT